jgi:hypothetical protein
MIRMILMPSRDSAGQRLSMECFSPVHVLSSLSLLPSRYGTVIRKQYGYMRYVRCRVATDPFDPVIISSPSVSRTLSLEHTHPQHYGKGQSIQHVLDTVLFPPQGLPRYLHKRATSLYSGQCRQELQWRRYCHVLSHLFTDRRKTTSTGRHMGDQKHGQAVRGKEN